MNKKIGCAIAYRKGQNNYGTSLQGYAMIKKIQQLGYDVEIITYIKQFTILDKIKWVINAYRCGLGRKLNVANQSVPLDYTKNIAIRTAAVDAYKAKKLLPLFHNYRGYDALNKGSKNYFPSDSSSCSGPHFTAFSRRMGRRNIVIYHK